MSKDPYESEMIKTNPYAKRVAVEGHVIAVLELRLTQRSLSLILVPSRALVKGTIVEVLCTDEADAGPQKVVNRVGAVAFFEVDTGGIVKVGDRVVFAGKELGKIAGFDDTHSPNHMNILFIVPSITTGMDQKLELGDRVTMKE